MSVREKVLKLNGLSITRTCPDCGKEYNKWKWSPLWCPLCDEKRVNRISESLQQIADKMGITK